MLKKSVSMVVLWDKSFTSRLWCLGVRALLHGEIHYDPILSNIR